LNPFDGINDAEGAALGFFENAAGLQGSLPDFALRGNQGHNGDAEIQLNQLFDDLDAPQFHNNVGYYIGFPESLIDV
jgi:hypothetical protein